MDLAETYSSGTCRTKSPSHSSGVSRNYSHCTAPNLSMEEKGTVDPYDFFCAGSPSSATELPPCPVTSHNCTQTCFVLAVHPSTSCISFAQCKARDHTLSQPRSCIDEEPDWHSSMREPEASNGPRHGLDSGIMVITRRLIGGNRNHFCCSYLVSVHSLVRKVLSALTHDEAMGGGNEVRLTRCRCIVWMTSRSTVRKDALGAHLCVDRFW